MNSALYVQVSTIVTGTGTIVTNGFSFKISLISGYEPCGCSLVMLCRKYRLIHSLFYVWCRDMRLCLYLIMFQKYYLILLLFEVLFLGLV